MEYESKFCGILRIVSELSEDCCRAAASVFRAEQRHGREIGPFEIDDQQGETQLALVQAVARVIGAARPNSSNEVKRSLSYTAKRPASGCGRRNRGSS